MGFELDWLFVFARKRRRNLDVITLARASFGLRKILRIYAPFVSLSRIIMVFGLVRACTGYTVSSALGSRAL